MSSEMNDTKIIEIGWVGLIPRSFLENMVIFNFLFILVTFQSRVMAFWFPYIVARKPNDPYKQNKERTYGQLYPP